MTMLCQKKLRSTNNELNPAKIENQTKTYVSFIIHELGIHVGDEGSTESTLVKQILNCNTIL